MVNVITPLQTRSEAGVVSLGMTLLLAPEDLVGVSAAPTAASEACAARVHLTKQTRRGEGATFPHNNSIGPCQHSAGRNMLSWQGNLQARTGAGRSGPDLAATAQQSCPEEKRTKAASHCRRPRPARCCPQRFATSGRAASRAARHSPPWWLPRRRRGRARLPHG